MEPPIPITLRESHKYHIATPLLDALDPLFNLEGFSQPLLVTPRAGFRSRLTVRGTGGGRAQFRSRFLGRHPFLLTTTLSGSDLRLWLMTLRLDKCRSIPGATQGSHVKWAGTRPAPGESPQADDGGWPGPFPLQHPPTALSADSALSGDLPRLFCLDLTGLSRLEPGQTPAGLHSRRVVATDAAQHRPPELFVAE